MSGVGPPLVAMPNQRKQGKKKIGAWVSDEEHAQLKAAMKQHGVANLAELLRAVRERRIKISPHIHALALSAMGAQQSGCGPMLIIALLIPVALYFFA